MQQPVSAGIYRDRFIPFCHVASVLTGQSFEHVPFKLLKCISGDAESTSVEVLFLHGERRNVAVKCRIKLNDDVNITLRTNVCIVTV